MTTPADIIALAFRDSGVLGIGQTANAEDTNDAFIRLNYMMAQWATKRWLVYHLITLSKQSTGAQFYTVGPGGDYDINPRPNKIESAFFRQLIPSAPNQVDYPLKLIMAREDYDKLALKQLVTFPEYLFYDSGWPLGKIYAWPIPQATQFSVHITVKEVLSQFTDLAQDIVLPAEYMAALHYNLCARLRPAYQMPPDESIVALAKDSLNTIRGSNTQIGRLSMPKGVVRPGIYNPYSDQTY